MIEEKIDQLITVMEGLTHSIDRIWKADKQQQQEEKNKKAEASMIKTASEKPKAEERKAEESKVEPSGLTHEELHTLCLDKVREDKANQAKIKALLKKYKAKLIKDLADDQLEAFKKALETA